MRDPTAVDDRPSSARYLFRHSGLFSWTLHPLPFSDVGLFEAGDNNQFPGSFELKIGRSISRGAPTIGIAAVHLVLFFLTYIGLPVVRPPVHL
jgi:hypothetical protein